MNDDPAPVLSPELLHKAALLKASPLFVDPTSAYALMHKQVMFLVLAGMKPVCAATSGHRVRVGDTAAMVADDPKQVAAFLDSLGLAYDLTSIDDHATDAHVSLHPELIQQIVQASDNATIGRLFGYPETAVTAFQAGPDHMLSIEDQERRETEAGIKPNVIPFRMSKDHWKEELKLAAQWQALLQAADLL